MQETTVPSKPKAKKPLLELYDWAESLLAALLAVIVVLTFVVRGTIVDGDSMIPTLRDSQFLILSRVYAAPKHNDIVVIYAHNMVSDDGRSYGKPIIKRVIGLPGDVISIDSAEGVVYRNGEPLALEYRGDFLYEDGHIINDYTFTRRDMAPGAELVVPDHHIFILGDNRNNSIDSRDNDVGMVNLNYVIGKVMFRLTPLDLFGPVV
jgi:signal peptidase I